MMFEAVYDEIVGKLHNELSHDLTYHGLHHTIDVVNTAELIATKEAVSRDEIVLVKTAALFHDTGFLFEYEDNEHIAIEIAERLLPKYGYSKAQIQSIGGMIEATIISVKPRNHLEEIMIDADFDYFGRSDFEKIAESLYQELLCHDYDYSREEWDEMQIKFLQKHQFYTSFSIENREKKKQKNLSEIIERFSKY